MGTERVYTLKESEIRLKLEEGRTLYSSVPLKSPKTAVEVMVGLLKELSNEVACVVNLNPHLQPINFTVVGLGDQNTCMVPMTNIFQSALLSGASYIMLLHNHPSGNVSPSAEDLAVTRKLIMAGNLLGIPLTDHVIVGGISGEWHSIRLQNPEIDFGKASTTITDMIQGQEPKQEPEIPKKRKTR